MTEAQQSSRALLAQAIAASRAHDSDTALKLFSQAIAADPTWGVPQFLLGSEYASLGDTARAELAFTHAVLLAPDLTVARYQLGLLLFSSGRPALALVTWQPLVSLPETEPLHHFVQGFAELAHDELHGALVHFRRGLAVGSTNAAIVSDIQRVVDGVDALLRQFGPGEPGQGAGADEAGEHVLLSNYHQHDSLH